MIITKAWVLSCATYIKECIRRIGLEAELDFEDGTLWTHRTPLPEGCQPELDDSDLLSELGIRHYQMLIGMAQWACTIGPRLDISFAVLCLSRFSAAPRTHHLELTLHLFGYLKKNPNRIVSDSRPFLVNDELRTES